MAPLLNINDIKHILPHRYPFLLVDRVIEFEPGKRLVARKNVTANEPFFNGHFPAAPVMPGVLIVEALAQAAGLLVAYDRPTDPDEYLLFAGIDNVRFRIPVVPGDVLTLTVEAKRIRRQSAHLHGTATVDGQLAVEADLLAILSTIPSSSDGAARWRAGRTFDAALDAED
ncbi:MAG: 3-hydroxyacyl-ACP dehydratase FabZ [Blastocatellia bacterium]|jgi:3-hydroxyacyl-[acyl-carrier-protein] dehydratase|nr:3-hydroxyacyl-ACP dehydratase FabZ [Blastocatellia bacterium]MBK6425135.1 3-hydroxyacyl-ACP dehydratase FabZ [Blastocatellia bacterium]